MKENRRVAVYGIYLLLGACLWGLCGAGVVDEYWGGMGSALLVMGAVRLVRMYRFRNDEKYKEQVEIQAKDERNQYIRGKASSWAVYLFVLIVGITGIIFRIAGQEQLSLAASYAVCLVLLLYYGAYLFLQKKY